MTAVIGIDPGMNGGLALLVDGAYKMSWAMPYSKSMGFHVKGIKAIIQAADIVVMEKVNAMPKQGVVSMFNFGVGYGILQGIVMTLEISLRLVTPQAWKKEILAGTPKDKEAAINYVCKAYTNVFMFVGNSKKPHDGICDSICIAEFGYRKFV